MPANRKAALQTFTLERDAIISVSMRYRSCKRLEFLRACDYLNNRKAKIPFACDARSLFGPGTTHAKRKVPSTSLGMTMWGGLKL